MGVWDYVIPSIIAGSIRFIHDVFGLYYLPQDPVVWIDTLLSAGAYVTADLIGEFGLQKMTENKFGKEAIEMIINPVTHGAITGIVAPILHSEDITVQLANFQAGINDSFMEEFATGFLNHILAQHLGYPLVDMLE